jgi:hypothetical protein
MDREPFFGVNAKPFFIQTAVGVTVAVIASYTIGPWIYRLSCVYLTGACQ